MFSLGLLFGGGALAQGEAPAKKKPAVKQSLPPLSAPLGRIGDILQPPPPGGLPGDEKVVLAKFPGCDKEQGVFLGRFLTMGAAVAGEEIQHWLAAQPALNKRLFGVKQPLIQAVIKARNGSFVEGRPCEGAFVKDGRMVGPTAPAKLCKLERGNPSGGGLWLFAKGAHGAVTRPKFTGAVALTPPKKGSKNMCLPILSATLYDARGDARLRYHADYNGEVEVELFAEKCQRVLFAFDEATQKFVPTIDKQHPACAKAAAKKK